jgi:hypothetical protein
MTQVGSMTVYCAQRILVDNLKKLFFSQKDYLCQVNKVYEELKNNVIILNLDFKFWRRQNWKLIFNFTFGHITLNARIN